MAVYPIINSFNAGEMSPYLIGRVDLDKYGSGCQRMENFRALPYGGAVRRPGTEFINTVIGEHRLKEFIYSTETSYVLAFGDLAIKIYRNGAYLSSSDVVSPYASADVFALQFLQINDVMYITHPDYAVRKLSRVTATSFTLTEAAFDMPPFMDVNLTTTTITPSATSGSITLEASANIFQPEHVGSYWKIEHFRQAGSVNVPITADGVSGTIEVRGGWTIRTSGTWSATVLVERSYNGGVDWEVVASYNRASDGQVSENGSEEVTALLRIEITSYLSDGGDSPLAVLSVSSAYGGGFVKITGVTDGDTASADVISQLISIAATTRWSEGAWSDYRGHPKCSGFFQDRVYFANTYTEPQRIWGSKVAEYEDFETSADDDSGLSFVIADVRQNPIQWLLGERSLIAATSETPWTIGGGDSGEPITPANINALRQPSNIGAEPLQPVALPGITLFLQRGGRKFRELFFQFVDSSYSAQDVTLLAEHITESGVKQFAASNHPDSVAYVVRTDGQLAVMVYERGQANGGAGNLVAWSRYVTDGQFESVAIIPSGTSKEDEVWCVVARRTDGGAIVRCIERFRARLDVLGDRSDWYFLDCGRTVDVYALKGITSIDRIAYGPTFVVDGETRQRVGYRVNATLHGLTQNQVVRISGTEFEELNGQVFKVCTTNANTFYLGLLADDHPSVSITGITQANPGVVTTGSAHEVDAYTFVFLRGVTGMTNVNGNTYAGTGLTSNTFSLGVNTSAFSAYVSGGSVDILFGSVQAIGYNTSSSGGNATVVTNAYNTASVLGMQEQSLVIDGSPVEGGVTPSAIDNITLIGSGSTDNYGSVLHAGLPYTSYLQINPLETPTQLGASNSMMKRIARVAVRFKNSVGAKFGPDEESLEDIPFRATNQPMDAAIEAFTGMLNVHPKMDIVQQADLLIVQEEPLNCEVIFIAPKAEAYANG